jgi:hypothetical protein
MLCTQLKQTTVLCVKITLNRQLNLHNYRRKKFYTLCGSWIYKIMSQVATLHAYFWQDNLNGSTAASWYSEATFYWTPLNGGFTKFTLCMMFARNEFSLWHMTCFIMTGILSQQTIATDIKVSFFCILYFVTFLSQVYLWNSDYPPRGEYGSDGVAPTQDKGGIGPFQPILTYPNPFPIPLTALK